MKIQKVLFLSPQLPYPPVSGGVIKSWRLVEFLSRKYELSVATFLKNDEKKDLKTFLNKVSLADHYFEEIDIQRTALNLVKSNLLLQPLNLYRNRSATFRKAIQKLIRNSDAIFVDHYEMFQYVPENYKGKVILHQHNCEYLIWDRFAELETNPLKRTALKNQAFWIRNYEKKICHRSDTILAAPNDIEELVKIGADLSKFYETFHLGEAELLQLENLKWEDHEPAIMFVGTLTWEANIDGVLYFLEESWPIVHEKFPELKFYIIGKNPDQRIIQAASKKKNVVLTGFVEDLDFYFKKSRVFISPLRFGSGIKVKVMNALYRGIPTVTTTIGAEGLAVVNEEHMLISNQPEQIAKDVIRLLEDKALWQKLSGNSRELAKKLYTWESVLEKVQEAIEKA